MGFFEVVLGGKQKELEERMIASISASRELTAQLKKTDAELKLTVAAMDKMINALCAWTQKADEIKQMVRPR